MKKYRIVIFILLIFLYSCGPTYIDGFTLYKKRPFEPNNSHNLKLDGVYYFSKHQTQYRENIPFCEIYLYNDGSLFYITGKPDTAFWSKSEVDFLEDYKAYNGVKEWWGHFIIRSDSIYGQYFHYNPQFGPLRNTLEFYGTVKNDTTIAINKIKCDWCNKVYKDWVATGEDIFDPPLLYQLHRIIWKPDSSYAWFKKQNWYNKGKAILN